MHFGDTRLPAAFWERAQPEYNSGCWLWTGGLGSSGYGRFGRQIATHLALKANGSPQPGDQPMALHSCDTPACVNPAHLRWGTAQDNADDVRARNRRFIPTHCPKGHAYTEDNIKPFRVKPASSKGWVNRNCRVCDAASKRATRQRDKTIRTRGILAKHIPDRPEWQSLRRSILDGTVGLHSDAASFVAAAALEAFGKLQPKRKRA